AALLVADHDQRSEAEAPPALHHLCDTVDGDELVLQLVARVALVAAPIAPAVAPPAIAAATTATAPAAMRLLGRRMLAAGARAFARIRRFTCHRQTLLRTTARLRGLRLPGPSPGHGRDRGRGRTRPASRLPPAHARQRACRW